MVKRFNEENMRLRDHDEDELSHYSNATTDIEYRFPFGWGEKKLNGKTSGKHLQVNG